ncbi:serine/threonine-protein kinase [Nonomuraea sp. M3C6]|uniref:Serine/threonine-protein kinase n=1 Tax=Nonomuraea marmarensis TaxID=3351344 RepID=A0ABW7APJ2_9ACTN
MTQRASEYDRLGPYRLLRRLGEGGMGVVHLAVDPQGREVAVKVLRGEVVGDGVVRRRLSREIETLRRARSKYLAEVLDADVTGPRPYVVTRYVPGRTLDEVVKEEGPLDLPALIRVAHGVASALASVHAVGVIHRDLKPGNVLILDGEPVLIDFGIAQAVDATRLTHTGMFIGTPGYLAPEIIEGQEAGPEADIHAWAGTLLFAATGQPPFGKGTLAMVLNKIITGKADIGTAPAELRPLLKAAFQRNPAMRPMATELAEQTFRMLASPLEESQSAAPPQAQPSVSPHEPPDGPPQEQLHVALLRGPSDPWPTSRVSAEELRQLQRELGLDLPEGGHAMPLRGEGDNPTLRVRPDQAAYLKIGQNPQLASESPPPRLAAAFSSGAGSAPAPTRRSRWWRAFADGLSRVIMLYPPPRRAPHGRPAPERIVARMAAAYTALGDPPPSPRTEPDKDRP